MAAFLLVVRSLFRQPREVKAGHGDVSRVVLPRENLIFVNTAYRALGCLAEVGITRRARFENFGDRPGAAIVRAHFNAEAFAVASHATGPGPFAFEIVRIGKKDVAIAQFEDAAHANGFEQGIVKFEL